MLVDDLLLVLLQLTLNDLFHQIDGYVHVIADLLRTDNISLDRYRYFYFLPVSLDRQSDNALCVLREILVKLSKLILYRIAQSFRYFEIFTADYKLHMVTSFTVYSENNRNL